MYKANSEKPSCFYRKKVSPLNVTWNEHVKRLEPLWYTWTELNVRQYSLSNLAWFSVCSHFFSRTNNNWDPIKNPENSVIYRDWLSNRAANRQKDLLFKRTFFECVSRRQLKVLVACKLYRKQGRDDFPLERNLKLTNQLVAFHYSARKKSYRLLRRQSNCVKIN